MLAICTPSRGLLHSRTIDDVLNNTKGYEDTSYFFSHGLNIPDSHNYVLQAALESKPDLVWLVEDDMHIPKGTIDVMLKEIKGHEIVVCDYPCGVDQPTVQYLGGKFAYAGLGCVLMRSSIFDKLESPIFRTDTSYQIEDEQLKPSPTRGNPHGLLDVDFWVRILAAGIKPTVSSVKVGHYYLRSPELPRRGNNTAEQYIVEKWTL